MHNVEEMLFLIEGYEEFIVAFIIILLFFIYFKLKDFKLWANRRENISYICRVLDYEQEYQLEKGVFFQDGVVNFKFKDKKVDIERIRAGKQLKYMKKLLKLANKEMKRYDKIAEKRLNELLKM